MISSSSIRATRQPQYQVLNPFAMACINVDARNPTSAMAEMTS